MEDITKKLLTFLHDKGLEIKNSTKNLRRNLENEFGDLLHFITLRNKLYIRPHNLSTDSIAIDFLELQKRLETFKMETAETEPLLTRAGK